MHTDKTIYRIQDAEGRGPYKPGWSHVWNEYRCLIDGANKPVFTDEFPDILNKINLRFDTVGGHFGCGFKTLEQLHNWFTPSEILKLVAYGYFIVKMDADEIMASSDNQTVFWRKTKLNKNIEQVAMLEAA